MGIFEEREAAFGQGFDLATESHKEALALLHERVDELKARIAELEAMLRRMVEDAYADHDTVARNVGAAQKLFR